MVVKRIKIKNFKSFGNNENILELSDKGELILMTGVNGAGKSSLMASIEYAIYGKVKGKKAKTVTLSTLPNRYNKNLRTEIDFNSYGKDINVVRSINPGKFLLSVDGEIEEKAGKSQKQAILENHVGIDFDTFKSFISMSINDFKNFMILTPEEKRVLLDRLFNLEMINSINKVLKEKKKQYKHQLDLFETEIRSYENSLFEFNSSIEKMKEAGKQNLEKEREELKEQMQSKKNEFKDLQERLSKCDEKEVLLKTMLRDNQEKLSKTRYEIIEYQKKIDLYDSGKCPTCETNLSDDTHTAFKNELVETVDKLKELYTEVKTENDDLNGKNEKLTKIRRDTQNAFSELKAYLGGLKRRITELQDDEESKKDTASVNQLLESIQKIENNKNESNDKLENVKEEDLVMVELSKLFSNDGIKKSIIAKIVKPINHFIRENIEKLGMEFSIELDDDFTARIIVLGEEINVEELSTGEQKKCNIAIMLAYLKLIRMKKHINILFLDEVFASIDIEGIYSIIHLLKDFANEYNINVFLVHHAQLETSYFDRVLKIEKNVTSNIVEEVGVGVE